MDGEVVRQDVVDPASGELVESAAEDRVVALLTPVELIEYEPVGPGDLELLIRILADRIERAPSVMVRLYEQKHRAEEAYQKEFSKMVIKSPNQQITMAREYAKFHSIDELTAMNLAKEQLRYAEWLQDALKSKLYGYLNLNKALAASYIAGPIGQR
ncbi:hypothetical protein B7R22_16980 [Subtercola boreus]|uniref:Uncharacterized protein n=1 Tax=Subtercola boreus TaxID=120213 RepID=A0A3E0VR65_9MICO|nr:hypothetical protein [Subtercola boreus]RFA12125.1 hypothetical protein B7R22_16980 [Subtercola boreus]